MVDYIAIKFSLPFVSRIRSLYNWRDQPLPTADFQVKKKKTLLYYAIMFCSRSAAKALYQMISYSS